MQKHVISLILSLKKIIGFQQIKKYFEARNK